MKFSQTGSSYAVVEKASTRNKVAAMGLAGGGLKKVAKADEMATKKKTGVAEAVPDNSTVQEAEKPGMKEHYQEAIQNEMTGLVDDNPSEEIEFLYVSADGGCQ
jgi:hypothetical protein